MREKLSNRKFCEEMQEVFEPSVNQQKKSAEELKKSITTWNEKIGNTLLKRLENYDEITRRNHEVFTKLTNPNVIGVSIAKVLADPVSSNKKSLTTLNQIDGIRYKISPKKTENCVQKKPI